MSSKNTLLLIILILIYYVGLTASKDKMQAPLKIHESRKTGGLPGASTLTFLRDRKSVV